MRVELGLLGAVLVQLALVCLRFVGVPLLRRIQLVLDIFEQCIVRKSIVIAFKFRFFQFFLTFLDSALHAAEVNE